MAQLGEVLIQKNSHSEGTLQKKFTNEKVFKDNDNTSNI